jgi:hypothetical protein
MLVREDTSGKDISQSFSDRKSLVMLGSKADKA